MDIAYGLSPFLPTQDREALRERAFHLSMDSARLSGLPIHTADALSATLELLNSYYSNLIEGQGTHPVEVDRAVREKLNTQNLDERTQVAIAVIKAERISRELLTQEDTAITSADFICRIHKTIYDELPAKMHKVYDQEGQHVASIKPGQLRDQLVEVGRHVPPESDQLEKVMPIFEREYAPKKMTGEMGLIAAAASHHRLAWIHPFLDGNGRVTRLFTQAYIEKILGHRPIWSISRGLARSRSEYYGKLAGADHPRKGDFDGRGVRSDQGLSDFCAYFLDCCLDQVDFMTKCLDLKNYRKRIQGFVERASTGGVPDTPKLDPSTALILTSLMAQGEITRGEAARLTGYKERKAGLVIKDILEAGLATSTSHVAPLRPQFPAKYLEDLFPKLGPAAE